MTDLVWLWVVYRVDSDAVFGAVRRAERLYRTSEEARSVVGQVADRMGADEIHWIQTDEATWVARITRYVCVVGAFGYLSEISSSVSVDLSKVLSTKPNEGAGNNRPLRLATR